jgi:predicted lipoprotein
VVADWKSSFGSDLSQAGAGSKTYPTTHEALNAVSDALFYLDTKTKDMKLGTPAGLSLVCKDHVCPDLVEFPHAGISKEAVLANLAGFEAVFAGKPPRSGRGGQLWGFADLLRSLSQDALAKRIEANIADAIAAVQAIDGEIEQAVVDPDGRKQVVAAYEALKTLTDAFTTDFMAALSLSVPAGAAGDND